MLEYASDGPVLVAGGSGVVGRSLMPLLAQFEARPLIVAARSRERAQPTLAAVRELGADVSFLELDLERAIPRRAVAAVVGLVSDPKDYLLLSALRGGVPFIDITRWTCRVAAATARVVVAGARAPVVLASGWMGGLLARVAALLATEMPKPISRIEGAVRYALQDAAGADSVDYMDRFWIPFDATVDERSVVVRPLSHARRVSVAGEATVVRRFDTPDQWTLPVTLGAHTVAVSLGFDRPLAGALLAFAARSGLLGCLASARFRGLRHAMLRSPGAENRRGARAAFRVDVSNADGHVRTASLAIDQGQAALTAVGAWLALRFALAEPEYAGVRFPEQDPANARLPEDVARAGVRFERGTP